MLREFKETAQVSEINPSLSSPTAHLLLNFWWAPLQRTFEERFEDKVIPVFARLCKFLHAVESMSRLAWNNELTPQPSTVTERKFTLLAASRPEYSSYLAMSACLELFVEVQCAKKFFHNSVKWKLHLHQRPLNSEEENTRNNSCCIPTIMPLLSLEGENPEFIHILFT